MSKIAALALVALVTQATPALARPPTPAPADDPVPEGPDPGRATAAAIAGTLAPAVVIAASMQLRGDTGTRMFELGVIAGVAGPSLGAWYAGKPFTPGLAARAIGGSMLLLGAESLDDCLFENSTKCALESAAFVVGGLIYLGGAIHDIGTAGALARERRRGIAVTPTVLPGKHLAAGLAIDGTF